MQIQAGKRFAPQSQLESRHFSERHLFFFYFFKSELHKLSYRPRQILAFVRQQADRDTRISEKLWKRDWVFSQLSPHPLGLLYLFRQTNGSSCDNSPPSSNTKPVRTLSCLGQIRSSHGPFKSEEAGDLQEKEVSLCNGLIIRLVYNSKV